VLSNNALERIFRVNAEFEIPTHVTSNRALDRVEALLCAEHVEVRRTADLVESVHMPLPFLNIDPRNYSRHNWVGFNPFTFLDAIAVSYRSNPATAGRIEVVMSRATAAAWFLFAVAIAAVIAARVPVVPVGIGFAVVFVVVSYIYLFHLPPKLAMRELETAVSGE